jgi:hypothetical protein
MKVGQLTAICSSSFGGAQTHKEHRHQNGGTVHYLSFLAQLNLCIFV